PRALLALTIGVTIIAGGVLVAIARPLIDLLFGAAFGPAAAAVAPLVLAATAIGVWKVLAADVVARGDSGSRATSALAGLVAMVAVDVVAIPGLGIRGAAIGAAVGYSTSALMMLSRWRAHTKELAWR